MLGRFGGNSSSGQYKNEDGCLIWTDVERDFEFVILLDAHHSAESAEMVIFTITNKRSYIEILLNLPTEEAFNKLHSFLIKQFTSNEFLEKCKTVQGETACLIAIRKDNYLWWLSIGDCVLALNHPELAAFGEFQQNHRSFYEWIGQNSTFHKAIPTYNLGIKELRRGKNHIFLTTDGLVECPNTTFRNIKDIFQTFNGVSNEVGVKKLLMEIKTKMVQDSTTIVSWIVNIDLDGTMPSNREIR